MKEWLEHNIKPQHPAPNHNELRVLKATLRRLEQAAIGEHNPETLQALYRQCDAVMLRIEQLEKSK